VGVMKPAKDKEEEVSPSLQVQRDIAMLLQPFFFADGIVVRTLEYAMDQEHIMDFTRLRALSSLFSMLNQSARNVLNFNAQHPDFPCSAEQLEHYIPKALVYSVLWSFAGDAKLKVRIDLGDFVRSVTSDVDEVIIDSSANWRALQHNGGMPNAPQSGAPPTGQAPPTGNANGSNNNSNNNNSSNGSNSNTSVGNGLPAIKQELLPAIKQELCDDIAKVMSPGSTQLPTWDNSQAMSPYNMHDMNSIANGNMMGNNNAANGAQL